MEKFSHKTAVWIATGVAVIVGLVVTKDANCLWGFFFPLVIS